MAFPGIESPGDAIDLAGILSSSLCDPIEIDGSTVNVEATVGIALFPQHGRTAEELIQAADIAMYASKEEKLSKIRVFDPQLGRLLTDRHLLERDLREAIDGQAISIVFQPIISGSSGFVKHLRPWLAGSTRHVARFLPKSSFRSPRRPAGSLR